MSAIPRLSRDTAAEAVCGALDEYGCVIIERLAHRESLDSIQAQFDALPEGPLVTPTSFSGVHTKRLQGLLNLVPGTRELAMHALVTRVCDRLLLPHCVRYQLNFDGLMEICPGENPQQLHRDGSLYPFRHPTPVFTIACMWAQREFTVENGGTRLIPGSHRWDHDREADEAMAISAAMPAGSLLMYTGSIYHGGGANRSDQSRPGLAFQYTLGWLRQEVNMYLTYPPEVAKTFPDPLARLIGYDLGGPYLGFVEAGSPHVLLEDNSEPVFRERSNPELDAARDRLTLLRIQPQE